MALNDLKHIFLGIIAAIISFDIIRTPVTNDVGIFLGVAHIADKFYQFPYGIDLAWEAKPIGNRIINYLLYNTAELFVPFSQTTEFSIVVKIIGLVILVLTSLYIAKSFDGGYTFWIIFFSLTTICNFCFLQAEWWAVLFTLVAMAMLCSETEWVQYGSGFFMVWVATIKGITGLLLIPAILCVVLVGKPKQGAIANGILGFLMSCAGLVVLQLSVWPHMLPDLLLAPSIAGAGRNPLDAMVLTFAGQGALSIIFIPAISVGIASAIIWSLTHQKEYDGIQLTPDVVLLWSVWVACAGIVFIHSEYFAYQYSVFLIPAICSILLVTNMLDRMKKAKAIALVFIMFMVVIWAAFNASFGILGKAERDFFSQQTGYVDEIQDRFYIDREPSVLYLDAGVAPFYLKANSSGRYICPLPFQRSGPGWDLSGTPAYRQILKETLAYNGTYIIWDGALGATDWFHSDLPDRKPVIRMIDTHYEKVWDKGWTIYKRRES